MQWFVGKIHSWRLMMFSFYSHQVAWLGVGWDRQVLGAEQLNQVSKSVQNVFCFLFVFVLLLFHSVIYSCQAFLLYLKKKWEHTFWMKEKLHCGKILHWEKLLREAVMFICFVFLRFGFILIVWIVFCFFFSFLSFLFSALCF